jgi:hypothetical protein
MVAVGARGSAGPGASGLSNRGSHGVFQRLSQGVAPMLHKRLTDILGLSRLFYDSLRNSVLRQLCRFLLSVFEGRSGVSLPTCNTR